MGAELQPIVSLLNEIDNTNPKDVLTNIILYSDGSGRVMQGVGIVYYFESLNQAKEQLQELLNRLKYENA